MDNFFLLYNYWDIFVPEKCIAIDIYICYHKGTLQNLFFGMARADRELLPYNERLPRGAWSPGVLPEATHESWKNVGRRNRTIVCFSSVCRKKGGNMLTSGELIEYLADTDKHRKDLGLEEWILSVGLWIPARQIQRILRRRIEWKHFSYRLIR